MERGGRKMNKFRREKRILDENLDTFTKGPSGWSKEASQTVAQLDALAERMLKA